MDPIIGTIIIFAGTFAPKGWAFCQGQTLSIAQNQALFALIGTIYGGDGQSNFKLPDLRGRAPVSAGQGQGLSNYTLGEQTGTETVTLTTKEMPTHFHFMSVNNGNGNQTAPAGNFLSAVPRGTTSVEIYNSAAGVNFAAQGAIQPAGESQAHSNIQPVLAINYIIALQGIFPSRD